MCKQFYSWVLLVNAKYINGLKIGALGGVILLICIICFVTVLSGCICCFNVLSGGPDSSQPIRAYICAPEKNSVYVVDTFTKSTIASIHFDNGVSYAIPNPAEDSLFVANGNQISLVDTGDYKVIRNITLPEGVGEIAVSPDGSRLYALSCSDSESSSTVTVIDSNYSVIATIPNLPFTWDMRLSPDGKHLYVGDYWNGSVTVIDMSTNAVVKSIPCFNPDRYVYQETFNGHHYWNCGVAANLAPSSDNQRLYVSIWSGYDLSVIDMNSMELLTTIPLNDRSSAGVAVSPDNKLVYVTNYDNSSISVVDASSNTVLNKVYIGIHPRDIEITPDGKYLYVCFDNKNVKIVDTTDMRVVKTLEYRGSHIEFGK